MYPRLPYCPHFRFVFGPTLVTDAAVGDIVFPQTKMVGDDSRHRRDAVGVDLLKLLDPAENPVDLGLQMRGFPRREPEARQPGDTFHHGGVASHSLLPFHAADRKSVVWGTSVSVRVDLGCRRC